MKSLLIKSAAAGLAFVAMTGCIDDKYDLSDIDTTARISVNNLVLPINIDEIKLESVIKTTDQIQVVDGAYAYVTDGTFDSKKIHVNPVTIKDQVINPANFVVAAVGQPIAGIDVDFTISDKNPSTYSYEATGIPTEIHAITAIHANSSLSAFIDLTDLKTVAGSVTLKNVKFQMPKNLIVVGSTPAGKYDAATGVFTLDAIKVSTSAVSKVRINFSGLNIPASSFNEAARSLKVDGQLSLTECDLHISAADFVSGSSVVQNAHIIVRYELPGFNVDSFDGRIEYTVDMFNIPSVSLNNIPDFLNQPGTNLVMKNPQLYLHANDPLQEIGLYCQTGFKMIAKRPNQPDKVFSINDPYFTIGKDVVNANSQYNFCLAPSMPASVDAQYPNPQFVKFESLANALAGDGLPKEIEVELVDPKVPLQTVNGFKLNTDYPAVIGTYKMVAPFDLGAGSHIAYTDTVDGWNDEDLDKITVESLEVALTVSTDVPVSVDFTGYPVDKYGKQINNVNIEGAKLDAFANNQDVTIRISGEIKNLDGIIFTASATAEEGPNGNSTLGPNLTIKLTNVRPKVSGYYEDEL